LIKELSVDFDIKECCAALRVSRSGFYRWQKAEPSRREKDNAQMVKQIKEVFAANKSRYSRKVVGWKLGETLEAELVVTALGNALMMRTPERGLYFHSDRGSQYSSQAVRKPLSVIGANLSINGRGPRAAWEAVRLCRITTLNVVKPSEPTRNNTHQTNFRVHFLGEVQFSWAVLDNASLLGGIEPACKFWEGWACLIEAGMPWTYKQEDVDRIRSRRVFGPRFTKHSGMLNFQWSKPHSEPLLGRLACSSIQMKAI
jgi:hypothetical protein